MNGITRAGYRLVYSDVEPEWMKHMDPPRETSFATSLGFALNGDGSDKSGNTVASVWWDSPAFKAGMTPGMQLQAVNDQASSVSSLCEAILAAEKSNAPIKLLVKRDGEFLTLNVDYHGGLRYPHLERVESTPDRLDAILAPVK
jgi:predicted metalloprotease with PDZ domain